MEKENTIDIISQKIIDHFFDCGARLGQEDYDFVKRTLKAVESEKLTQSRQDTLNEVLERLEYMRKEKITFGKSPDMAMPYNQMLIGYSQCLEDLEQLIKEMR